MPRVSSVVRNLQTPNSVTFQIKDPVTEKNVQLSKTVGDIAHEKQADVILGKNTTIIATPDNSGNIFTKLQELGIKFSATKGKAQKPAKQAKTPAAQAKK